jgi:hypothetical protein
MRFDIIIISGRRKDLKKIRASISTRQNKTKNLHKFLSCSLEREDERGGPILEIFSKGSHSFCSRLFNLYLQYSILFLFLFLCCR